MDEGAYVQISCSVITGDEPLKITWSLHGDVISSDPSITTTMIGTRSSILIISKIGYRHSGNYACRATNNAGADTYSATLRVNGTFFMTVEDVVCRLMVTGIVVSLAINSLFFPNSMEK